MNPKKWARLTSFLCKQTAAKLVFGAFEFSTYSLILILYVSMNLYQALNALYQQILSTADNPFKTTLVNWEMLPLFYTFAQLILSSLVFLKRAYFSLY